VCNFLIMFPYGLPFLRITTVFKDFCAYILFNSVYSAFVCLFTFDRLYVGYPLVFGIGRNVLFLYLGLYFTTVVTKLPKKREKCRPTQI